MSIIELQFTTAKMNTLLQGILHEQFLQVNPYDAPYDQTYLVHHVEIPDFSFAPSSGGVLATVQPRVHLVSFASVVEQPNQVAPPTNMATMSLALTISDNPSQTSQLLIRVQDNSIGLANLSGFLTTKQQQVGSCASSLS